MDGMSATSSSNTNDMNPTRSSFSAPTMTWTCANCRRDRQKCKTVPPSSACEWCIQNKYDCHASEVDSDSRRRKLSRFKCVPCRAAKQKCLPEDRLWPEICELCKIKNLPCSEPVSAFGSIKVQPAPAHERAIPEDAPKPEYTVALLCALPSELAAIEAMLDETYDDIVVDTSFAYSLGKIGQHNTVIVVAPTIGVCPMTKVQNDLIRNFSSLQIILSVGVGQGNPACGTNDIRLGDVVVSYGENGTSGQIQYDLRTGEVCIEAAPLSPSVNAALQFTKSRYLRHGTQITRHISTMLAKYPAMTAQYSFPGTAYDRLFESTYVHGSGHTCVDCSESGQVLRPPRVDVQPRVHFGRIASGNMLIKDACLRDRLGRETDALCFEMEAAGVMDVLPAIVIRGICDYADTHKNTLWQAYAAASAAAFAKDFLTTTSGPLHRRSSKPVRFSPLQETPRNTPQLWNAPAMDQTSFFGRESELRQMMDWFDHGQKFLWISGLPGMGKTQLAITYALRNWKTYESVTFIDATDETSLFQSFQSAHYPTGLHPKRIQARGERALAAIHDWPSGASGARCLLIFDNCDPHMFLDIKRYYHQAISTSIIVTTCRQGNLGTKELHLGPVTNVEYCLRILQSKSGRSTTSDDISARDIVQRLCGVPAAIAQTGSILRNSILTHAEYLVQLENQTELFRRSTGLPEYQYKSLYSTWELSLKHLNREDSNAGQLLKLLCFFDSQNITYDLLSGRGDNTFATWLSQPGGSPIAFYVTMSVLVAYHFVEVQDTIYSLHQMIKAWILSKVDEGERVKLYWYALGCVAANIQSDNGSSVDHQGNRPIVRHAINLVREQPKEVWEMSEVGPHHLKQAVKVARLLQQHSETVASQTLYQLVMPKLTEIFGNDDQLTLSAQNGIGVVYLEEGNWDEAYRVLNKAYSRANQILERHDPLVLDIMSNLARLHTARSQFTDAERILLRAIRIKSKVLGLMHLETLESMTDLGSLLIRQHRLEEAQSILNEALEKKEKILGTQHPSILDTLAAIGMLHIGKGYLEAAEAIYRRVVAEAQKLLGLYHRATLDFLQTLGLVVSLKGQWKDAEDIMHQVLSQKEALLGTNHHSVLSAMVSLGKVYEQQKRYSEAETLYEQVLAKRRIWLSWDRAQISTISQLLGDLYLRQGKDDQAKSMYESTLMTSSQSLNCGEGPTDHTIQQLMSIYQAQHENDGTWDLCLKDAVLNGRIEVVRQIIERRTSSTIDFEWPDSLLSIAASNGDAQVLRLLLDAGASVDDRNGPHKTALQTAACNGHLDTVMLLLDHDADLEDISNQHGSALQMAVAAGHLEIVELLIAHGADVNDKGGGYNTALQMAVAAGHLEIVELLIAHGADVNDKGGGYNTALQTAAAGGNLTIVQLLVAHGANVNLTGGLHGSPLHAAAIEGHVNIVRLLIDAGADIDIVDAVHGTPLCGASMEGHTDIVQTLLQAGANIHRRGGSHGTAAKAAIAHGHEKIAKLLTGR